MVGVSVSFSLSSLVVLCLILLLVNLPFSVSQDDEPGLPSHMPSPPDNPAPPRPQRGRNNRGNGTGTRGNGLRQRPQQASLTSSQDDGLLPLDDASLNAVEPNPPPLVPEPAPPPPPPPTPVIFGLNNVILILVPQFKVRLLDLPEWIGANCKVSLPVSIFFDKLKLPQPPLMPPTPYYPPSPFYGPLFPMGHYVRKRSIVELVDPDSLSSSSSRPPESESRSDTNEEKTSSHHHPLLNEETLRAERVTLIPKLEKLLGSFGLEGKKCLLRAVCESHEFPVGYGLAGEILTTLASISKSAFADTHLSDYLEAENAGREGDCSQYVEECRTSLFYWERVHHDNPSNHTETGDFLEAELELLDHLFQ